MTYYPSIHGGFRYQFNPAQSSAEEILLNFTISPPPGQFRVFIPPGAKRVGMTFYNPNDSYIGVASRFLGPPDGDYSSLNQQNFFSFPWKAGSQGTLAVMIDDDYPVCAMGGMFVPIYQFLATPMEYGGWMYFKIIDVDPNNDVEMFQYSVHVNRLAFAQWLNSYDQWDALNDPLPVLGSTQGQVEPEPVPVTGNQQCTIKNGTDKMFFLPPGVKLRFKKVTPRGTIYKVIR